MKELPRLPSERNHVRAQIGDIRFTSKLIDGRFPEYSRVIPAAPAAAIRADRDVLRQALQRTAILSNEKYRGIRVTVKKNVLTVQAHNPEQEEAEEEIEVGYEGNDLEVGFNVNYLLDALAAIDGQEVELGLTDSNSSCLIRSPGQRQRALRRDADEAISRGLSRLQVTDFRCLQSAELHPDPHFTLISGPNASGKTSLLEAIYVLGPGPLFPHPALGSSDPARRRAVRGIRRSRYLDSPCAHGR